MSDKIYIGKVLKGFDGDVGGEKIYLTKHSFDCNWYWGFGYIGNNGLHTHFDSEFGSINADVSDIFEEVIFDTNEWYILKDLFIQAYALQNAAAVYRHGGYYMKRAGITDIIENSDKANIINSDLEIILDTIWLFVSQCSSRFNK